MPTDPEPAGEPVPSEGCSSGNANPSVTNSIVTLPDGYDGSTPVPVVIAFHANGNPNTQLQGIFGDKLGGDYMMVYPSGGGDNSWQYPGDKASGFDGPISDVLANACVDTSRIYSMGHSGGAQFLTQLLCNGEDRFRAVVPVASSKYCNGWDSVAALVIHGLNDEERGSKYNINDADGAIDFGVYRDSNGCGMESTPFEPMDSGCPGSVDPGCLDFQGCDAATQFCNHNDPQYGTTNHGVPCFGPSVVFAFFESQK
jgi:polyhydroxybutyrate depolymerase